MSAIARQPSHPFFRDRWRHLCVEVKAPDIQDKPLSHAADRWERCRNSVNAAVGHFPQNPDLSADTLAHGLHYLQDNLAPRGETSLEMHREMIERTRALRDSMAERLSFYRDVESAKAGLQSQDNLEALFQNAQQEQQRLQNALQRLMLTRTSIRDREKGIFWRSRSLAELSADERNQFKSLVRDTLAYSAAFTERTYELYLERVDPGGTADLNWEFTPSGVEDALADEDVRKLTDQNRQRTAEPSDGTIPGSRPPLSELVDEGTGPIRVESTESAQVTAVLPTPSNIAVDEAPQQQAADELLPVVARGGPWRRELEGAYIAMTTIVLTIREDGTATLSACQFQAPPLILNAEAVFSPASRGGIQVDPEHPEVAIRVEFSGNLRVKGMTFLGEVLEQRSKVRCVVTRRADGSWLVRGIDFPQELVLQPDR